MTKDLMYKDEIQDLVCRAYRELEAPGGPGAGFYSDDQLAAVPPEARDWTLGVGNPLAWAEVRSGEHLVDLGCGAGVDTLLAATEAGPTGRAVGIDVLPEMVERARTFAAKAALGDSVAFHEAEMEALPLPDESVDLVISNGSINLSARKSRVLAEAHRVLRPGGRLCVSDLTLRDEELPSEILTHPSAWAG